MGGGGELTVVGESTRGGIFLGAVGGGVMSKCLAGGRGGLAPSTQ